MPALPRAAENLPVDASRSFGRSKEDDLPPELRWTLKSFLDRKLQQLTRRAPSHLSESETEMVQVVLPNDANPLGFILGGTVMHLIDIAGAIACHRHTRSCSSPPPSTACSSSTRSRSAT